MMKKPQSITIQFTNGNGFYFKGIEKFRIDNEVLFIQQDGRFYYYLLKDIIMIWVQ